MGKLKPMPLANMRGMLKISNDGVEAGRVYELVRTRSPDAWYDAAMQELFVLPHNSGVYYVVFHRFDGSRISYVVIVVDEQQPVRQSPPGYWFSFDNGVTSYYVNADATVALLNKETTDLLLERTGGNDEPVLRRFELRTETDEQAH